ncbi:MAG TPA: methyltransferase domain-containing protein [Candidatus Nitrosotalea sp.]|nr:methyltransferase domain-containing protein [Candidatus Nitrosotalea sp.]
MRQGSTGGRSGASKPASELVAAYRLAASSAPPGSEDFSFDDLFRLSSQVQVEVASEVPAKEWEAALGGEPGARRRVVRALFWPLVYHLRPHLWDRMASLEPINPELLDALPQHASRVLEVGAGGGRLTVHLAPRADDMVAIEPAPVLRRLLRRRFCGVDVVGARREAIPIDNSWADLSIACSSMSPDPAALAEMERCTRRGGMIILISPLRPEWFEERGFKRRSFPPGAVSMPPCDPELERFFGPRVPPSELLWRRRVEPT